MPTAVEIDVIIPVFNGEAYIRQAIQSALDQTLKPSRIIVVDDGSTDHTVQVVRSFLNPEVRLIEKPRGGPNSARNAGLIHAHSPYSAFLDADDLWLPQKLEKQMQVFQNTQFPTLALVYCDYGLMDECGRETDLFPKLKLDPTVRGPAWDRLIFGNFVLSSTSGVLCKREIFDRLGVFDETLRTSEDWEMWLRISDKYAIDYTPDKLVLIRRHSENVAFQNERFFFSDIAVLINQQNTHIANTKKLALIRQSIRRRLAEAPHREAYRLAIKTISLSWPERILAQFGYLIRRFITTHF